MYPEWNTWPSRVCGKLCSLTPPSPCSHRNTAQMLSPLLNTRPAQESGQSPKTASKVSRGPPPQLSLLPSSPRPHLLSELQPLWPRCQAPNSPAGSCLRAFASLLPLLQHSAEIYKACFSLCPNMTFLGRPYLIPDVKEPSQLPAPRAASLFWTVGSLLGTLHVHLPFVNPFPPPPPPECMFREDRDLAVFPGLAQCLADNKQLHIHRINT